MRKGIVCILTFTTLCLLNSCKGGTATEGTHPAGSPAYSAIYNDSTPPVTVDVEQFSAPTPLKLSQIAYQIEYYTTGDANYTVTQAINIPDSNAFLTLNYPRIYLRRAGKPSKRYGFKALAYKWHDGMNKQNLFYDKKTTRLYCALSGKDQNNRKGERDSIPYIGELPPLDSMLTITNYVFPESMEKKYTIGSGYDKLLGFSSSGYTLCHYEKGAAQPGSILTFNLQGDTLCKFQLKENYLSTPDPLTQDTYRFQTSYWNEAQDRMTFMIPFCDTVYQLVDDHTLSPLYNIQHGEADIYTLYENPAALFIGLNQAGKPKIVDWVGWPYTYKPTLTHQTVYLKEDNKTYLLPRGGFVNDLDEGLPFWPDGQTDNCLYMIRTVTEMREMVKRTGSPRQKELIEFLDNPNIPERDYVMIVVKSGN